MGRAGVARRRHGPWGAGRHGRRRAGRCIAQARQVSGTVAATRPVPCHDTAAMRTPGRASAHLGVPAWLARCLCIWLGFLD